MNTNRPTVRSLVERIKKYYELPGNGVGGSLHVVVDDGNTDDSSIRFCIFAAQAKGDVEGYEIAKLLLLCSKTQRTKIYRSL